MATRVLRVVRREVRTSKNDKTKGKQYAVIHVQTPNVMQAPDPTNPSKMILVKCKSKDGRGNVGWEKSNLPSMKDQEEFCWGLNEGDVVAGDVVSRAIEPKEIEIDGQKRVITTATVTVFGDSDDKESFEVEIAREFGRRGFTLATTQSLKAKAANEEAKEVAELEKQVADNIS